MTGVGGAVSCTISSILTGTTQAWIMFVTGGSSVAGNTETGCGGTVTCPPIRAGDYITKIIILCYKGEPEASAFFWIGVSLVRRLEYNQRHVTCGGQLHARSLVAAKPVSRQCKFSTFVFYFHPVITGLSTVLTEHAKMILES